MKGRRDFIRSCVAAAGAILVVGSSKLKVFAAELFGTFLDPLNVEFLDEGRKLKLLNDYRFQEPGGRLWNAKKDSIADGASIPQVFWSFTGGPLDGPYRKASVIHDFYCDRKNGRRRQWADTHFVFYSGMRAAEVSEVKAKLMYYAVVAFGPRWVVRELPEEKEEFLWSPGISDAAAVEDVKAMTDELNAGEIALETLVVAALSKGEQWFREELRATAKDRAVLAGLPAPDDEKRIRAKERAAKLRARQALEREERYGGSSSSSSSSSSQKKKKKKRFRR